MTKECTGCKHLSNYLKCMSHPYVHYFTSLHNPAGSYTVITLVSIDEARKEDGFCGLEAKYYTPTFWYKWFRL